MRKILFALVFVLATNMLKAQEQVHQDYIFISVTHFFESTYLLSFEHFNPELNRSWHLSAGLIARDGEDRSKFGGMVSAQRRFYFIDPQTHKESLERGTYDHGIYFAPYFTYKYVNAQNVIYKRNNTTGERDTITQHVSSNSIQGGLLVGFQFNISHIVYIDTYFGGGIHYPGPVSQEVWDTGPYPITYRGVMVKAGISAGIKF